MKRFTNQLAVISGGADGIGYGIAERIAAEGGHVVLFDINEAKLKAAISGLEKKGYNASGRAVNISSEKEVQDAVAWAGSLKHIDIMINSAAIVGVTDKKIADYEVNDFDHIYQVNLRGAFLMTKYVLREMEKTNYGRVLLIASIAGKEGNPFMCGYSSMKAGVIGLVKAAGKEYAKTAITINGLAPAVIRTPMNENTSAEQLQYMTAKIPMGRLGTVQEVASLATWIVSKEASFNTGFVFDISGGRATY